MPRIRGRTAQAQQQLGNAPEQAAGAEDGQLPGANIAQAAGDETPQQPYLAGHAPTKLVKVHGVIKDLENQRGAIGERLEKAQDKADSETARIDREVELLRQYQGRLEAEEVTDQEAAAQRLQEARERAEGGTEG